MRCRSTFLAGTVLLLLPLGATAQVGDIARSLGLGGRQSSLSDSQITSGMKEALQVGATNAVKSTGKTDGYFGNQAIKILLPKNLTIFDKGLRAMGYGPKIDSFVLSMNRAAEAAAPAARKIFVDAILSMSFDDARKILSGGETAATDYFKRTTIPQLGAAFTPIVKKTMGQNDVTQQYNALLGEAQSIPFLKGANLDITQYVTEKALDGLFYMVGEEEKKIRRDPGAQVTSLLKQVFGR
jgi:hypothetical protein